MLPVAAHRRRFALVVLATSAWAGVLPGTTFGFDKPKIETILARATAKDGSPPVTLAQELLDLGTGAVPNLIDVLALETERSPGLEEPRARVLLTAFEMMGAPRWRPVIDERLGSSVGPSLLSAVFAIEEHCGLAADLPVVIRAAGLDAHALRTAQFEQATTHILLRDAAGFAALDEEMRAVPVDIRTAVVRAVEATKKPAAALLLAHWIEVRRDLRLDCLPYLSRLSLALDKPIQPDVVAPVRALVESGDGDTLREAILCSGRLEDCAAVPYLVRWLREGEAGARQDALWALRSITRLRLGDDAAAWNGWYTAEAKWWDSNAQDAFALLANGSKAEKVATLCRISTLHMWREKLASEVVLALDDADPDIAALAAAELKRLDSRVAVPGLVDALMNPDERIAGAAHAALESILKRALPPDAAGCRDALSLVP